MTRDVLDTPTVSCMSCAAKIEDSLGAVDGVQDTEVNIELKRVSVDYDPATLDRTRIISHLDELGYPATPLESAAE